jgi:hypothetical protein
MSVKNGADRGYSYIKHGLEFPDDSSGKEKKKKEDSKMIEGIFQVLPENTSPANHEGRINGFFFSVE